MQGRLHLFSLRKKYKMNIFEQLENNGNSFPKVNVNLKGVNIPTISTDCSIVDARVEEKVIYYL